MRALKLLAGRIGNEWKIMGSNFFLISAALTVFLVFVAVLAGDLINISNLVSEVIFPFYASVAVGEWGETRADRNYETIAAQNSSVLGWCAIRYIAVAGAVSIFAAVGMATVWTVRKEMSFAEMAMAYFPTAFALSSLSVLFGLFSEREHVAATACGVLWLMALMARGLLRIRPVRYIYPFIWFAGGEDDIWILNKGILCVCALAVWGLVRRFLKTAEMS